MILSAKARAQGVSACSPHNVAALHGREPTPEQPRVACPDLVVKSEALFSTKFKLLCAHTIFSRQGTVPWQGGWIRQRFRASVSPEASLSLELFAEPAEENQGLPALRSTIKPFRSRYAGMIAGSQNVSVCVGPLDRV
jgi:hypothetical protein